MTPLLIIVTDLPVGSLSRLLCPSAGIGLSNGTGGRSKSLHGVEDTMRKVFSLLDDEQRQALIEVVDLSTAIASAGLIVTILKVFVDLMT